MTLLNKIILFKKMFDMLFANFLNSTPVCTVPTVQNSQWRQFYKAAVESESQNVIISQPS